MTKGGEFVAIMPDQMAQHTVENYSCSRCWGSLFKRYVTNEDGQIAESPNGEPLSIVKCRRCERDFGFVTNHFIENERIRDFGDAFEVKRMMVKMGLIPREKIQTCQSKT